MKYVTMDAKRCPKCKNYTVFRDVSTGRDRCHNKECGWESKEKPQQVSRLSMFKKGITKRKNIGE